MSTNAQIPDLEAWASIHFEQRQSEWDGTTKRSFRQLHGRNDRPTVWSIWVEDDRYFTEHGLLDGKLQQTSKKGKAKNIGKANELSPDMDALAEARRLCRKKWDFEGYDEFVGDVNIDNRHDPNNLSIPHLLTSLPSSFCLYKPHNNLEEAKALLKKAKAGKVLYTLKRNGLAMWIVVDGQKRVHMYSRRNRPSHKNEGPRELPDGTMSYAEVIPWTRRFPHLDQAVQGLDLPPYTMMACELVSREGDEKTHFAHVQSVEKSLTDVALLKQKERGWLGLYWWDIPFYGGVDLVSTKSVSFRHQLIHNIFDNALNTFANGNITYIQRVMSVACASMEDATVLAKEMKWEGFVVVDPEGIYGDRAWNLKGKPDRPRNFCAKLKPWYEDDFIAIWDPENKHGTYGKGRHEQGKKVTLPDKTQVVHGGVGSVGLFQYNSAGELVYISDCSSGMDYEYQARLRRESFPQVWEVKFTERSYISNGDDTNALTFAGLVRVRTDKAPAECINEEL